MQFVPAELARPAIKALEANKELTLMDKVKKATDVLMAAEARLAGYNAETRLKAAQWTPEQLEERLHRAQMIKNGIEAARLVVRHFHKKHKKEFFCKKA